MFVYRNLKEGRRKEGKFKLQRHHSESYFSDMPACLSSVFWLDMKGLATVGAECRIRGATNSQKDAWMMYCV